MTFDLDPAAAERRDQALAVATDVVRPAADAIDVTVTVPPAVRDAMRTALPADPASAATDWVIALEALATVSPAMALVAAGEALGAPAVTSTAQWTGLRGVDVDGLGAALGDHVAWQLAVSATLIGAARAAVEAGVAALKAARAAGTVSDAGQPLVADAATAVDASRLLLWDAARYPAASEPAALARGLARAHALESVTLAWHAAERACGAEAFRPGAPLERVRRDALTTAQVLGDPAAALAAVAAGTLPA